MSIFTLKKIGGNIFCFQPLPFKLLLAEPSTKLASEVTVTCIRDKFITFKSIIKQMSAWPIKFNGVI